MATTSFEGFADHCMKFSALWSSVKFGMLSGRGTKGPQLLGLHATFGNYPVEGPRVDALTNVPGEPLTIVGVAPFKDFIRIIQQMDQGEFRIENRTFKCASFSSPDQLVLRARRDEHLRSPDLVKDLSRPWPALFLRRYGLDISTLGIDEVSLNTALQRGRYRYDSLFYLSVDKLGFGVGGSHATQIELLAPLYISVFAQLSQGKLVIQVEVDTSISSESFFAKVWHGPYRDGVSEIVEFGDAQIVKTSEAEGRKLRTLAKDIQLPPSIGQSVVVLILDGEELDYCSPSVEMKPVAVPTEEKTWTDLVIHGPEEGTEDVCFVLMAMNSQMRRIFKDVFEPVAKEFNLIAEHSDMLPSSTVVPEIIKKIHTAKVVLADVTRHRPNVYYEIGFAHKVNPNKVIIIGQELHNELPSDIDQQSFRYIHCGDDPDGLLDLSAQLSKRIQNCLDQRRE